MIYLTFNDAPSGVYYSQVTDVCRFVQNSQGIEVRLVAFISLRNFFSNRRKIKKELPGAIVIPMFPRPKNWKINGITLSLFLLFVSGRKTIICRGIFAANLGIRLREKGKADRIIFDARGAYKAEFEEYLRETGIRESIGELEKKAILHSDFRLAVSHKLVEYWTEEYGYNLVKHVVVPCTLGEHNKPFEFPESEFIKMREKLGFEINDILFVFSGSGAGWQSEKLLDRFILELLKENTRTKILLLARFDLEQLISYKIFPGRIKQAWIEPADVKNYLCIADFGLLLREESVTNRVSSPVKFAEYLASGLKVIVSRNTGDFGDFVIQHNCGYIAEEYIPQYSVGVSYGEREKLKELAKKYFLKENYQQQYIKLTESNGKQSG